MDENLRIIDLIPRRWSTLLGLFIAGVAMIVLLLVLYAVMPYLVGKTTDGSVAAFDLEKEGSICTWYSSTLLFMAGLVSLVVYSIRRYHADDQHYFRVWLWAAVAWFFLSIDESASLHEGFKAMMPLLTGSKLMGDGSLWWVIPYCFFLAPIGLRLFIDMRSCRMSAGMLVLAGLAMAIAIVAHLNFIFPDHIMLAQMIEEGAEMFGFLFVLSAVTLHARYLILEEENEEYETDEDEYEYVYEYEDDYDEDEYEYDEDELAAEEAILFDHPIKIRPPHGFSRQKQKQKLKGKKYPVKKAKKKKARTKRSTIAMHGNDAFSAGMRAAERRCGRQLTSQEKEALRLRIQRERRERGA
ncbi:MAG: hypothetical protein PVH19_09505 [Planctomycetia bacterium]|jgi:hypothetical protein